MNTNNLRNTNANLEITRNMSPREMVHVQQQIARSWGHNWTVRQAANHLWHIGWLSDAQWNTLINLWE